MTHCTQLPQQRVSEQFLNGTSAHNMPFQSHTHNKEKLLQQNAVRDQQLVSH